MTVRRAAMERVGHFDATLGLYGDEQEWQERLLAETGMRAGSECRTPASVSSRNGDAPILYVAAAALDHRRSPADARLRSLARAARARGRASRRYDAWRGEAPTLRRELRTLAGCLGHVVRRRCPAGLTMVAHSLGRFEQGLRERRAIKTSPAAPRLRRARAPRGRPRTSSPGKAAPSAVSTRRGASCTTAWWMPASCSAAGACASIAPRAARLRAGVCWCSASSARSGARWPARSARSLRARATTSRCTSARRASSGSFRTSTACSPPTPPTSCDWLVVVDDDVVLPPHFLDRLLFLAERFDLQLVQPAHRARSHAAWRVTRRRARGRGRQTPFVEIGPVTAFARATFPTLLPFPDVRMGWGLDMHWAALAREHGWRCGVLDAVAIRHSVAPAGEAYSRGAAVAEARALLAERPHLTAAEAQTTLVTHRHW